MHVPRRLHRLFSGTARFLKSWIRCISGIRMSRLRNFTESTWEYWIYSNRKESDFRWAPMPTPAAASDVFNGAKELWRSSESGTGFIFRNRCCNNRQERWKYENPEHMLPLQKNVSYRRPRFNTVCRISWCEYPPCLANSQGKNADFHSDRVPDDEKM